MSFVTTHESNAAAFDGVAVVNPMSQRRDRPRVLIVPNVASWIIGQMATHIIERFSHEYEFWFLTDKMIKLRPDIVRAIIPSVDFVFPLTDKAHDLLKQTIAPAPLPRSLFWIHHVTSWGPTMTEAVSTADELIVCTPEWKTEAERRCSPGTPVTVVPHGVDLTAFSPRPSHRKQWGIPEDHFVVGFVGSKTSNFDEGRKGLDILFATLQSLHQRVPNLHVAFLGLGWDAEVQQLRSQGISANYVGFLPQSKLADFYCSVDAYLLTSRVEGGPCTVLEAMACKTPVVATSVGLVPRTISNGSNGFCVPVDDTPALVDALAALAASPALRHSIGQNARRTVERGLSWSTVLEQLEQPLARMAAKSQRLQQTYPLGADVSASRFQKAVYTADGLLFAAASFSKRIVGPKTAYKMAKSCLENCAPSDVVRGIGLAARLSFRPAPVRELA